MIDGWIKLVRSDDVMELIKANPNAFVLATVIAFRARWKDGFNEHNLAVGEALLGDYKNYGMTEQNYRTAKGQLEKWGFVTFQVTPRGTIAKLCDSRLFEVGKNEGNGLANTLLTDCQRTANGLLTTNEEGKKERKEEENKVAVATVFASQPKSDDLPMQIETNVKPIEIPQVLRTADFEKTWAEWVAYRRMIRKTLKPSTQQRQLNQLAKFGEAGAIESLTLAMLNQWQGFHFSPKVNSGQKNTQKPNFEEGF